MLLESKSWCRVGSIMFLEVSFPPKFLATPTHPLRRAFCRMEFTGVIFNVRFVPSVHFILNKARAQNILGIVHFLRKQFMCESALKGKTHSQ